VCSTLLVVRIWVGSWMMCWSPAAITSAPTRPRHHPNAYAPPPQSTSILNLESRKAWGSACGRPPPPGFARKLANPGGGRLERGLAPLASQPGYLAWFGFSSGLGVACGYSPPPGSTRKLANPGGGERAGVPTKCPPSRPHYVFTQNFQSYTNSRHH
jgi:hypothetical protein